MAGRYLLDMGHREVAIIAEQNRASGRMRLEGFKKSLTDEGVVLKDEWTLDAMSKIDDAKAAARKIFQLENRPTAVFASTDLIAAIFIKEARKAHIRIPNEISIVGFDDTIYAELTEPGLTTIAQPKQELAKYAMEQLLKLIKDPRIPQQRIMLSPRLVERKSVRNLKNL